MDAGVYDDKTVLGKGLFIKELSCLNKAWYQQIKDNKKQSVFKKEFLLKELSYCGLTASAAVTLGLETVQQQINKNWYPLRQYKSQCQKVAWDQNKNEISKYLDTIEIPNCRGGR